MSGSDNRSKGDLNNAGNVLGSLYNTNQYDSGYKEKKGMKFFWIMLIIVFVVTAAILMIKPYPTLSIVRADNEGLTSYLVDINVFGVYDIVDEKYYPYPQETTRYLGLEGKYAFIAMSANSKEADMIVAPPDILGVISDNLSLKSASDYLNIVKADTDRMLQNVKNGYYGLPVSTDFKKISFNEGEYVALMPKYLLFTDRQIDKIIKNMTSAYD